MKNVKLNKAKKEKNDEFYTRYEDIEKEVINYKNQLKDKIIYCNCDNPEWSNFYNYFYNNFNELGIKKLITTHFKNSDVSTYKLEVFKDNNDELVSIKTNLLGDGSFKSDECIEILKEADIVITNPPFSLFREFITLLKNYDKKFLIIGSLIITQPIFKFYKNNELWYGINQVINFTKPNNEIKKFGNIGWYTNLKHNKNIEYLQLSKEYDDTYIKYDNYDAINVDRVKNIPKEYKGLIGVPISFLNKFNSNQFEIIELFNPFIQGKEIFKRIIIRNKLLSENNLISNSILKSA